MWQEKLKPIYDLLIKDILLNVRTALAAGFKEIINLLPIKEMDKEADKEYFLSLMNHFLKDGEDKVSALVLPTLCTLVSKFSDAKKQELLETLIKQKIESIKNLKNGRDNLVRMLEQLFEMFQPSQLMDLNFHEYLFDIIWNERAINYKVRAAKVIGSKIVVPLIKGKKHRALLTAFTDKLRISKNFRDRQIYICIATSAHSKDNEIFKKHFAKNIATDMENEKCQCVLISLAKLCAVVKEGYSKSLDKVRAKLLASKDPTIIQYMPNCKEGKKIEQSRRYLALNYGEAKG